MSLAVSLKHQQPTFMAVKTEKKKSEQIIGNRQKRKINKSVLVTWVTLIILTILFWYFILKLFI